MAHGENYTTIAGGFISCLVDVLEIGHYRGVVVEIFMDGDTTTVVNWVA